MNEDFNTPVALAVMFELANEVNRTRSPDAAALLRQLGGVLGVLQQAPRAYLQGDLDATAIEAAIAARQAAKAAKDYAEADRIRKDLAAQGVELKDGPQGTTWVKA
jgi:cysteinyl-tRNA synthetase